jgi:transcriptional regulator with XRE-family HTH domain
MNDASNERLLMGQRVRNLRKDKCLTLEQLAKRTGISTSNLSKIERGLLTPAYNKVSKIAVVLDVEVSVLYSDSGAKFQEGEFLLARAGEVTEQKNETYTYELLFAQSLGKTMLPALCTLKPLEQMTFKDHMRHTGQEFIYVLEGKLTLHLEGKLPKLLEVGDCAYFDSDRGHIYAATNAEGAKVLILIAPPPNSKIEENLSAGADFDRKSTITKAD